jgi:glycosyltransferase involved in cell wall biosynthesis
MEYRDEIDISIVLPTCDREYCLPQTIAAILDLNSPASALSHEVLIVDNNPSEATRSAFDLFVPTAPCPLRYIPEPRRGVSFARNTGVREARGEYIAFVDDDCTVDPDWLRNIMSAFDRHACDIVQGKVLLSFEDSHVPEWIDQTDLANFALYDCGDEAIPATTIMGGNVCIRRSVFEEHGLFDVRLGGGAAGSGEDLEFFQRIRDKDVKILYVPDVVVHHRIVAERLTEEALLDRYYRIGYSRALLQNGRHNGNLRSLYLQWKLLGRFIRRFYYDLVGNEIKEFKLRKRIALHRGELAGTHATPNAEEAKPRLQADRAPALRLPYR